MLDAGVEPALGFPTDYESAPYPLGQSSVKSSPALCG